MFCYKQCDEPLAPSEEWVLESWDGNCLRAQISCVGAQAVYIHPTRLSRWWCFMSWFFGSEDLFKNQKPTKKKQNLFFFTAVNTIYGANLQICRYFISPMGPTPQESHKTKLQGHKTTKTVPVHVHPHSFCFSSCRITSIQRSPRWKIPVPQL